METYKLSTIVLAVTPELYSFLKPQELDSQIVLRNGMNALDMQDVLEIIEASIAQQNDGRSLLH